MPWHIKFITLYLCLSACMCAKLLQLSLTLCDPMDCSPPGFSVRGIFQASLSMGYGSGLPCPTSGVVPTQGSNPDSCVSCISRWVLYHWCTWEAPMFIHLFIFKAFIEHITILLLFFLLVFSFLANESLLYDVGSSSLVFYDNLERRVEWSGTWEGGSRWMGHMCTSGCFMLIYGRN